MQRRDFFSATVGSLLAAAAMGSRECIPVVEEPPAVAKGPVGARLASDGTWDPVSEKTWREAYMRLNSELIEERRQKLAEASQEFVRRHVNAAGV